MAITTTEQQYLLDQLPDNIRRSRTADGKEILFGSFDELLRRLSFMQQYLEGRGPRVAYVRFEQEAAVVDVEGL